MNFSEICKLVSEKGVSRLFVLKNTEESIGAEIPIRDINAEYSDGKRELTITGIADHELSVGLLKSVKLTPPAFAHPINFSSTLSINESNATECSKEGDVCTFTLVVDGMKTAYKIFLN